MRDSATADIGRRLSRCAVFDLDGTLVDTAPTYGWAINTALAGVGARPLAPAAVRACIGHGPEVFIERALEFAFDDALDSIDPATTESIWSTFLARLTSEPTHDATRRDLARELLEAIRSNGGTVGVCTNKPQQLADRVLSEFGLDDLIEVVIGGDAVADPKPAPDPLLVCIERTGSRPADAVFVGDSSIDLDTGAAAGVPVVLISGGYEPGSDPVHAPLSIDGFDELICLLSPEWKKDSE